MLNHSFAFKQFLIRQDRCAMKVGTDGVLLGAWADVNGAGRILDVGTGTGLIAIMMAQRSGALIEAIEIDEESWQQAVENVNASPWKDRIRVHHDSLQHFITTSPGLYDVVVSNPPYFSNSLKPPSVSRSRARHDDSLGYESLLSCAGQLLSPHGMLSVIIPAVDTGKLTEMAYFRGLFPSRMVMIKPLPHKSPSRCMVEFTADRSRVCNSSSLIIRNNDRESYTDDYKDLTGDFYLRLI